MAKNYDNTDLFWARRGDITVSDRGDIADTFEDPLRSLVQEYITRIRASKRDWALYPRLGAQLADYVGEANTKEAAEGIKTRIISSLAYGGLLDPLDIKIRYAPIDIDKIMFRVTIKVDPTARNVGSETLTIGFIYSYSENNIYNVGKI